MPPRGAPSSRGGPGSRGGPPSMRGRGGPPAPGPPPSAGGVPSHVNTIGVRRPGVGSAGKPLKVVTNHFGVTIPEGIIHHYDVVIDNNADKTLPARLNMEIIAELQNKIQPNIFNPRVVYDGRKNIFSPRQLPLGDTHAAEFQVSLSKAVPGKAAKPFRVRIVKVAEINPEVLARFLLGKQSHEATVLTATTALNVVIRMAPSMLYPFNVRSFFTPRETEDIGSGIVLWRGYFQSVRPAVGRMLVNIDISTGTMYKPGNLYPLCMDVLEARDARALYVGAVSDRDGIKLSRFLSGVRVTSILDKNKPPRVIKRVMHKDNAHKTFQLQGDTGPPRTISIARYFKETFNKDLQHPDAILVEVGKGAFVPLEVLMVPPGQIMKKTVPPHKTKKVLEFATKKPKERLKSIRDGLSVLNYTQSEYMRSFNMKVDESTIRTTARVLVPPTLKYGAGSKQPTIQPRNGQWNMMDKKFYLPGRVSLWAIVVYERQQRFGTDAVNGVIKGLRDAAKAVGIPGFDTQPMVEYETAQGDIPQALRVIGGKARNTRNMLPTILVCILPDGATDVYTAVKHFGDILAGVATQCLKASKCARANAQYYANVMLKINVKLGGVNTIPEERSVPFFSDPTNPVLVMGADVIHPAPGSEGRPSFTALVGNVDSAVSKYVATSRVQTSRKEIIEDMGNMSEQILAMYMKYRSVMEKKTGGPRRVVLYRDGVSEGQFQAVLDEEVPQIKAALDRLGMNPPPRLTVVVVGKRHHVRMFPENESDGDKTGNCPSGTVIDSDIVHPTEFDFYLQSHGGLLGTSRPAHYSVLFDENNFTADALQQLSFALCHVFARSTRTVSIPAPVYYADIVCGRAKTHYDPQWQARLQFSDDPSGSQQPTNLLSKYKENFKPVHTSTQLTMYFN